VEVGLKKEVPDGTSQEEDKARKDSTCVKASGPYTFLPCFHDLMISRVHADFILFL
jgi:hypothetical protein